VGLHRALHFSFNWCCSVTGGHPNLHTIYGCSTVGPTRSSSIDVFFLKKKNYKYKYSEAESKFYGNLGKRWDPFLFSFSPVRKKWKGEKYNIYEEEDLVGKEMDNQGGESEMKSGR
jgi:hypothetical protein